MYLIDINNISYRLKQNWNEITINEAIEIMKVINKMPERLREYYDLILKKQTKQVKTKITKWNEDITLEERVKIFPAFYGKMLYKLSNAPQKVIDRVDWQSRTNIYNFKIGEGISCESVVIGLLSFPFDYKIQGIESFKLKGEALLLPVTRSVLGEDRPMGNEPAITFTESADLEIFASKLSGGVYERATNIISILCRPKGEEYDEEKSLKRAESMGKLTMDIFWEVFFCIIKQSHILKRDMLICLLGQELKTKKQYLKVA